jgi:hypothetical protein
MSSARAALYWGSAILAGLVLGCAGTVALVSRPGMGSGISSGPWHTSLVTGSIDADLYTRAVIARRGLLALAPQETLYYTATTDSEGRPLSGNCDYQLHGRQLAARWWSVTAYGADSFLIPNPEKRYSLSQTTVARKPSGLYVIHVGTQANGRNWLPVRDGEPFDLTVRLYNPDEQVYQAPGAVELPRIDRVNCR